MTCFYRITYQSRASKQSLKRVGTFKYFKILWKNNNEKLELLKSFQKKFLASKVPPGPRGPRAPLATPLCTTTYPQSCNLNQIESLCLNRIKWAEQISDVWKSLFRSFTKSKELEVFKYVCGKKCYWTNFVAPTLCNCQTFEDLLQIFSGKDNPVPRCFQTACPYFPFSLKDTISSLQIHKHCPDLFDFHKLYDSATGGVSSRTPSSALWPGDTWVVRDTKNNSSILKEQYKHPFPSDFFPVVYVFSFLTKSNFLVYY